MTGKCHSQSSYGKYRQRTWTTGLHRPTAPLGPAFYDVARNTIRMPNKKSRADTADHADARLRILEGYARIGLAVFIVLFVAALIAVDPRLSSKAQVWTQALLAFALAALMASMAGAVHVEGRVAGVAIRGTAGFAVFLIAWYSLPKFVPALEERPQAALKVSHWTNVDFRIYDDPATANGRSGQGSVAITVPLRLIASSEVLPAQPAIVQFGTLTFSFAGKPHSLPWQWFVTHTRDAGHPNREWLSSSGRIDVAPFNVDVGTPAYREVMFQTSSSHLQGRNLMFEMAKGNCPSDFRLNWSLMAEGSATEFKHECRLDCDAAAKDIGQFLDRNSKAPHRLGVTCLN